MFYAFVGQINLPDVTVEVVPDCLQLLRERGLLALEAAHDGKSRLQLGAEVAGVAATKGTIITI